MNIVGVFTPLSLLIVCFANPEWSSLACLLTSSCALALFWWRLKRYPFVWGTLFYAIYLGVQLRWLVSIDVHGFYIVFVYGALVLLFSMQFGLFCKMVHKHSVFLLASFWTFMEWLRLFLLAGFPFYPLGMSMTYHEVPMQMASVVGVYGLTFWVVLVNLLVLRKRWKEASVCFLFPYLFGILHLQIPSSGESRKVALVQTGLRVEEKSSILPIYQWHAIFASLAKVDADLIVLPESVVPFQSDLSIYDAGQVDLMTKHAMGKIGEKRVRTNIDMAEYLSEMTGAEVILGLDGFDTVLERSYCSAYHIGNGVINRYDKRILMPMAEYLPLELFRPFVSRYGIGQFFHHGQIAKNFSGVYIPTICYEECFGNVVRRGRGTGNQVLVNLTNDAWYPDTNLPMQHYLHARLRAVENGCPLIRATNNGVSAVVDRFGRTVDKLPDGFQRDVLVSNLSIASHPTLYSRLGDGSLLVVFAFGMIYLALKKRDRLFFWEWILGRSNVQRP